MIFNVMTLFVDFYKPFLETSIIGRAIKKKIITVNMYNIRDFSTLPSKQVDDYLYGGGSGMLMMVEPIYLCFKHIISQNNNKSIKTIYLSPRGKIFNNEMAKTLSKEEQIILLSGHYEGIDERAIKLLNAEEISIGDYILTGGEIPSMVLIDSISRYVDGVLSNEESYKNESLYDGLLECEQYTRPYEYENLKVPDILLSGDHKKIKEWRTEQSILKTKQNREDLYKKYIENTNGGDYERNN